MQSREFEEGRAAAYLDTAKRHENPYMKGDPLMMETQAPEVVRWAALWEMGFTVGEYLRHLDLADKRLEFAKGLTRS